MIYPRRGFDVGSSCPEKDCQLQARTVAGECLFFRFLLPFATPFPATISNHLLNVFVLFAFIIIICVFPCLDEYAGVASVGHVLQAKHVKPFLGTLKLAL
jgi:hypothetical protein